MKVLVTGAGGAAGIAVIKALGAAGVTTIAADADPLAAGCHLADTSVALPLAADPTFPDAILAAATHSRPDAIVCTVAEEMPPLASVAAPLADLGAAVWLSPVDTVRTCVDKARFAAAAVAAGLPVPATHVGDADGVPGPWVVKPRFGRGSRDVQLVDDRDDLPGALRRTPDPIVQARCQGREFTVDALVERDGSVVGLVPRWRLETKAGISTKGETFSDERVAALVRDSVAVLGLRGVCNIQGFVDDATSRVWLVEVNPRFSGGLPLSLAAGADLVGEFLRGTLGEPIRAERLTYRDGVVMTRHLSEVFISPVSPDVPPDSSSTHTPLVATLDERIAP